MRTRLRFLADALDRSICRFLTPHAYLIAACPGLELLFIVVLAIERWLG